VTLFFEPITFFSEIDVIVQSFDINSKTIFFNDAFVEITAQSKKSGLIVALKINFFPVISFQEI